MNQITINNRDVSVVEYSGQRVVTLAMIDEVHQRPEGTARKRFNDNKARFVEGEDFLKISASEFRTRNLAAISTKATEDITLLTESGYLMLVKSFTDDLAWQVQRQLVRSYFRQEAPAKVRSPRKSAVSSVFRQAYTIAKIAGLDDNQAALRAGQYCESKCGENPLPLMGLTYLEAPENERTLSPTEIADALGLPGKGRGAVGNDVLLAAGMQRFTYVKGRKTWTPTEKGEEFARLQDVSKAHCAGSTMIYRWSPKVLDVLRAHLGTSATPYGAVSASSDSDLLGGEL